MKNYIWIIRMLYNAFKFLFIKCMCVHVPRCACRGQKITRGSWFSPYTMWNPGKWNSDLQAWESGPFIPVNSLAPVCSLFSFLSSFLLHPTLIYPHLHTVLQTNCIYFPYTEFLLYFSLTFSKQPSHHHPASFFALISHCLWHTLFKYSQVLRSNMPN